MCAFGGFLDLDSKRVVEGKGVDWNYKKIHFAQKIIYH